MWGGECGDSDKGMIQVPGGVGWDGPRLHHITHNDTQLKT